MSTYRFYLREAASDAAGQKILSDFSGAAVQLDFSLAAGAALAVVQAFLTPAPLPGRTVWEAGDYTLTLDVTAATSISYTAEIWRADKDGADIAQIGSQPALQTGTGLKTFSIAGTELAPVKTDRLKLKLLVRNDDAVNGQTFSVHTSVSDLATPILVLKAMRAAARRLERGRFIGFHPRPGEPKPDSDGFLVGR